MLSSYVRMAIRHLLRNRVHSSINIFGLSIGIACCLLLTLYVNHEMSYDQHHDHLDQLYRIDTYFKNPEGENRMRTASPPIAMTLMEEVSGIEYGARILDPPQASESLIRYEDQTFFESGGLIADSTVFHLFKYTFLEGNPDQALVHPNSVVISKAMASRMFGNNSALDRLITINQGGTPGDFRITGVFDDIGPSIIHANFFTSINSSGWAEYLRSPEMTSEWVGSNFVPSFVRLREGADRTQVEDQMNQTLQKYGAAKLAASGRKKALFLEPVKDIYLKSDVSQQARAPYVYGVFVIGVFILLIACINFMNLSTARAVRRSSEIGIRKVMGALRGSLVRQLLAESFAFVSLAAVIGVAIAWMALPWFSAATATDLSFEEVGLVRIGLTLAFIVVATAIIAGSYPAFYMASFQPAVVLKGKQSSLSTRGWLRQSLVVFQFFVAIVLICGTMVVARQMNFVRNQPLGFNADAKVLVPLRIDATKNAFDVLRQEFLSIPGVQAASGTDFAPGSPILYDAFLYAPGHSKDETVYHKNNVIDPTYLQTMGIELAAGRQLTLEDKSERDDFRRVLINERSARAFGFTPEAALGQILTSEYNGRQVQFEVIGVMKDFHQTDLHEEIAPTLFFIPSATTFEYMVLSVGNDQLGETIKRASSAWSKVIPDVPFEFKFLDQAIEQQYQSDLRTAQLINIFSVVAICISCLGLYALSAFMTERRFREIGIRKVMGATISQILVMMSSEHVKLILVSFLFSIPVAWWALNQWLQSFAYRIQLSWSLFGLAGLFAIGLAILTVGFEAWKAAHTNPAKSLKSE